MDVIIISMAIIVVAIVLYLCHLGSYNKKFRELKEAHKKTVDQLADINTDLINLNKKKEEEFNDLVDSQKNVILSQRQELASLNVGLLRLKDKNELVVSQKKSSEVKLGLMAENFMPFLDGYPYDHKNFRFLANPCDGIQFNDDSVIFIEFKTGNAKLSSSQRRIKDLVGQGSVRFETFRVDEKGAHLKVESSMENLGD